MSDEVPANNVIIGGLASATETSISTFEEVVPIINIPGSRITQAKESLRITLKRILDFSTALLLLVSTLPLACLIVLVIALTRQQPFHVQTRMGWNHREFGCLTFTTIRGNAEVTRVGQILRVTALDELPQLLNILIGDMSFIGPRPVAKEDITKLYGSLEAAAYFSSKPGLIRLKRMSDAVSASYSISQH